MKQPCFTILLTGANGFTGSYLYPLLQEAGYRVISLSHRATGRADEVVSDFTQPDFVVHLNALPQVDAVVHLGARIGWDGGTRADLLIPNVLASAQLAAWANQQQAYFIFASAALIAGPQNTLISPEIGWDLFTDNDYLYSKWLAEKVIAMSGVTAAILRIGGIFGAYGPTHLGLNRAITNALAGKPPTLTGPGLIKRNYIYVKDLCAIILWLLHHPTTGTYLVGGRTNITIKEMLETICQVLLPTGTAPLLQPGHAGYDQIIQHSPILPQGRSFKEALMDIQHQFQTTPTGANS